MYVLVIDFGRTVMTSSPMDSHEAIAAAEIARRQYPHANVSIDPAK